VIVIGTATASNTTPKSATATCSGTTPIVIGGGGRLNPNNNTGGPGIITETYPSDIHTWTASGTQAPSFSTVAWSIQAYAICGP
jgi:hypothetical protein